MTFPENNSSQLSEAIEDNLLQLSDYIYRLSSSEHATTVDRFRLIHELGAAAYHLSLARDQLNLGTIETDIRNQEEKPHYAEPEIKTLSDLSPTTIFQASDSDELPASIPEQLDVEVGVDDDIDIENEAKCSDAWDKLATFTARDLSIIKDMVEQHVENKWFRYTDYKLAELAPLQLSTARVAWHRLQRKLLKEELIEVTGHGSTRRFRINQPALKAILEANAQKPNTDQVIQTTRSANTVSADNSIVLPTPVAPATTESPIQKVTASGQQPTQHIVPEADETFQTQFKQQLSEDVTNYLSRSHLPVKLSTITGHVADTYRVDADSAREWINMLVKDGACHIKSSNGTRMLIPGPPPMGKKPEISSIGSSKNPNRQSWSETDAQIAYRVVAALVTSDKGPQGIVMHNLVNNIRGEYPSGRVIVTIGKLLSQGFVTTGEEPVRQRSHSKKQSPPNKTLRFRDDETYERVKANPEILKLALKNIVD